MPPRKKPKIWTEDEAHLAIEAGEARAAAIQLQRQARIEADRERYRAEGERYRRERAEGEPPRRPPIRRTDGNIILMGNLFKDGKFIDMVGPPRPPPPLRRVGSLPSLPPRYSSPIEEEEEEGEEEEPFIMDPDDIAIILGNLPPDEEKGEALSSDEDSKSAMVVHPRVRKRTLSMDSRRGHSN